MGRRTIPENLLSLHAFEEELRIRARELVDEDNRLSLHVVVIERAMNMADVLRQYPTEDEDMKVVQILGMRMFNAFGASMKLALSGYGQNSALIIRDILETVFLLDLFSGDPDAVNRWRHADKSERMKHFSPVHVRKALDTRDGFQSKKRAEHYNLFSELAAHPTMKSVFMMRPEKEGDAVNGPFIEASSLEAVLSEMGCVAMQAGAVLDHFFPETWMDALAAREAFATVHQLWLDTYWRRE